MGSIDDILCRSGSLNTSPTSPLRPYLSHFAPLHVNKNLCDLFTAYSPPSPQPKPSPSTLQKLVKLPLTPQSQTSPCPQIYSPIPPNPPCLVPTIQPSFHSFLLLEPANSGTGPRSICHLPS